MRTASRLARVALAISCWHSAFAATTQEVRTLVPTFAGPASLAENVSTILALRLWTTLRKAPTPNPRKLDFGSGNVLWSVSQIDEPSNDFVEAAARGTRAQLVLWGFVEDYGPGVIAQPVLSLSDETMSTGEKGDLAQWEIVQDGARVRLGLPSRVFEFSPLILERDFVQKYSRPDQLHICRTKVKVCTGPAISKILFRATRQEGDFAFVQQAKDVEGWVYLPDISSARGEVIDFTGGMIAYLRKDFEQASTMFTRVAESAAGAPLKFEASVMAGIADIRYGKSSIQRLTRAVERNPYSRYAVQALVMGHIVLSTGRVDPKVEQAHREAARSLVGKYIDLFEPNDPWLVGMQRLLRQ